MRACLLSTAAGLVLLFAVPPASAQMPRPERPYRGLFGGGIGDTGQLLTATATIGGGWTDNVVADARGGRPRVSDLNTSLRGTTGLFTAGLSYSLTRSRVNVGAAAATSAHYYPSLESSILRRNSASIATTASVARGLSVNASAAYAPYSLAAVLLTQFQPAASETPAPDLEIASSGEHYLAYSGGTSFARQLSRRTSLSADYGYRNRNSSLGGGRFKSHSAGGRLNHILGRGFNARAGYRYSNARYADTDRAHSIHLIDAGLDYSRSLSFSRRTTLSFGTGTTATTRPNATGDQTRFRANGRALLNHEIGRSWHAALGYHRGVQLSEGWSEPVMSDSVTASVGGQISRRIRFASSARASTGQLGFREDGGGGFDTYQGIAKLDFALARYVSLGFSYSYYHHAFGPSVLLAPGFTGRADSHSIRGQLSVWAPLFQRSRRADATR